MKILAPLALLAAAFTASGLQAADEGPWMVQASVVRQAPANKSDAFYAVNTYYQGGLLQTAHVTRPEVALSYAFTKYLSAQASLGLSQSQTLTLFGTSDLGTFKATTSCYLLQWHFIPGGVVNPYVGLGMNVTRWSSTDLSLAGNPLTLSAKTVGLAFQAGLDVQVASHWYLNAELKQLQAQPDLNVAGAKLATFTVSPMLYSLGIGYRF